MAAVIIVKEDLAPFATIPDAKAEAMIIDAMALAARIAPCILTAEFADAAAAKAIIRGVILRWNERGSGARQQAAVDDASWTYDTKQRGLFWPSEIEDLQGMCQGPTSSGAFTVDSLPCSTIHAEICSLNFGAEYCSCGADIAGFPLWENV